MNRSASRAAERTRWLVLVAAILAGVSLRLNGIGTRSLWLDELCTYWCIAEDSLSSVWNRTLASQNISPLFPLLLFFSKKMLGNSELSLRLPSAVFSILSLPLIYHLAKKTLSREAALISMALLALAEPHIAQAGNARPYSAAVFFFLLSLHFLLLWFRTREPRHGILFALCATVMGTLHYVFLGSLVLVPILHVYRSYEGGKTIPLRKVLLAVAVPLLCQGLFAQQLVRIFRLRQALDWAGEHSYAHHLGWRLLYDFNLMGYVLALLCAYTMARVFTEQSPWEIDDRSSNLLFTWCLFSFGGLALYLILSLAFNVSTPLEHHYVMLFTIPSYLLLPVLASTIRRRVIKATFLAVFWILFVLPIAASLVVSGDITSRYREDWKAAIYFLDRNADDGDTVLFHSGLTELNVLEDFRERGLLGYLRFPLEGYYLEKDLNIMTVGYPWLKGTDRYHKDLLQDALSLRNPVWTFERFGARQGGGRLAAWLAKGVSPAVVRTGKSFTTKNLEVREVMIVREGR